MLLEQEIPQIALTPYGGMMSKISEKQTPFPHRKGNLFMIHYMTIWTSPSDNAAKHLDWVRKVYEYMTPYVQPRTAYVNHRDLDVGMNKKTNTSLKEASVWGSKYFKDNFYRLAFVMLFVFYINSIIIFILMIKKFHHFILIYIY